MGYTMKLLYCCSADLSGEAGSLGSVRHIMEVAENLCARGHSIRLLAPRIGVYPHATPVRITYIPCMRIRYLRTIVPELLSPLFLAALVLLWNPDAVYWRQAYLTVFPVLLSRLLGKKIITEVNGLTVDEIESEPLTVIRKKVILAFERFNYRFSNRLICVAPQIRLRILERYKCDPSRVSVILNGINAVRMPLIDPETAKRKIGIDPHFPVIGFVGHLFPWDGLETLIAAAPAVIAKVPDSVFLIVGHGQWGTHLHALVDENKLGRRFVFTGKVPWEELYLYVNSFDVATAPYSQKINSASGRSSLKLLEYFACNKPVVASRTAVIPEIADLEEKNLGITVPPEDPEALAQAIITVLTGKRLNETMGAQGRAYVMEQRSWSTVAQKTDAIVRELVNRR